MATTEQKNVTAETVISAVVRYNNNDDAARTHDVSADVSISTTPQGKSVGSMQNGYVREKGSAEGSMNLATFNTWGENNLSVTFQTADNTSVLAAINKFVADVEKAVKNTAASINA